MLNKFVKTDKQEMDDYMENKKKILYITEAMGGGVFTYLVGLSNELINNYDIYIAYSTRSQTPSNYREYFDSRIHLIKVENFVRSINPIRDICALREIKKIANEIKPDIIHLHSSKAGVLGRIGFSGKKYKLFYTPHGYSFLMRDCNSIKRMFYKSIEFLMAKSNCITISCSKGEHSETLELTNRAKYVNNGIDTKELDELISTSYKKNDEKVVFTSGRICYQKNPCLFNEIALSMPNVTFIWIGDGEMRNELTAPNIKITGWVDRRTVIKEALKGDVFLLTSLWEGLPISLLESMYMEKLCVVSDVIGNHDVIENGVNGYVCNTLNEYVKAINGDCGLSKKAKQDVLTMYNTLSMAESYDIIYNDKSN